MVSGSVYSLENRGRIRKGAIAANNHALDLYESAISMNIVPFSADSVNKLPKKKRKDAANAMLRRLLGQHLFSNVKNFCVSPDTVRIAIEQRRPDSLALHQLGFRRPKRRKQPSNLSIKRKRRDTYVLHIKLPHVTVTVHWTRVFGRDWLSVTCSLPRFVHGSNFFGLKSTDEILAAIDELSRLVSQHIKTDVDLRQGHFSRLDLFLNLYLENDKNVNFMIALLRNLLIKRRDLLPLEWKTTTLFRSPAGTHELEIYNKSRKAKKDGEQNVPPGVARVESRYLNSKTVLLNAKDAGLPGVSVEILCQTENLETLFFRHLPD
jgi:hypothetical protein